MLTLPFWLIQFGMGAFGTAVYFLSVKTGFVTTPIDDPVKNPDVFNMSVILAFVIIGGVLPVIFEVQNYVGCFIQGLVLRPTIISLYQGSSI